MCNRMVLFQRFRDVFRKALWQIQNLHHCCHHSSFQSYLFFFFFLSYLFLKNRFLQLIQIVKTRVFVIMVSYDKLFTFFPLKSPRTEKKRQDYWQLPKRNQTKPNKRRTTFQRTFYRCSLSPRITPFSLKLPNYTQFLICQPVATRQDKMIVVQLRS